MKNFILTFSYVILFYCQLVGQSSGFNFAEKHNYFFLEDKVYDVRNFKQVTNAPTGQKMPLLSHDQKQVLLDYNPGSNWSSGSLRIIDKTGKQKYAGYVQNSAALISYERNGILSVKENDIWYTPINLETGTLLTPKRLTNLGIFQSGLPMFHWYGDNVLINTYESCYAVNLENGQIMHLPFLSGSIQNPIQSYFIYSPSGRYIICPIANKEGETFFYFDMKTLKQNYFNPSSFPSVYQYSGYETWLSGNEMIFWNGLEQSFYLCDLSKNKCKLIGQAKDVKSYVVDLDMRKYKGKMSVTMSTDTTFMAVPFLIRGQGNAIIEEYVNFFNIRKSTWVAPKLLIQPKDGVMMTADQELAFAWISSNKLIYKQIGGIDKQGTWLFDIEKNENTKLTSFITDKILVLPEAGYTIFIANNHLFRIKNDGSGFQQLTTSPLRNSNLSIFSESLYDNSKTEVSNHLEKSSRNYRTSDNLFENGFLEEDLKDPSVKKTTAQPYPSIPIGKFTFIANKSNPNLRINVENGLVAGERKDGDWSAHWSLKPVPNTNYYWIENRWRVGERLHVERGSLASEKIGDEAWSAHWIISPAQDGFIIQNRWRVGHRIHIENGRLECSVLSDSAKSVIWLFNTVNQ
jgi:hypothetical protein